MRVVNEGVNDLVKVDRGSTGDAPKAGGSEKPASSPPLPHLWIDPTGERTLPGSLQVAPFTQVGPLADFINAGQLVKRSSHQPVFQMTELRLREGMALAREPQPSSGTSLPFWPIPCISPEGGGLSATEGEGQGASGGFPEGTGREFLLGTERIRPDC